MILMKVRLNQRKNLPDLNDLFFKKSGFNRPFLFTISVPVASIIKSRFFIHTYNLRPVIKK